MKNLFIDICLNFMRVQLVSFFFAVHYRAWTCSTNHKFEDTWREQQPVELRLGHGEITFNAFCLNTTVLWHSWAIGVIDSQCASLEPLCEQYRIWKSARDWQMDIKIHEMTNSNKTSVKFVESLDVRIKNRIGRFVGCVKRHHRFWISLNSQREVMKSIEGFLSRYCDYRLWSFCGGWVRDMHEVLLLVCLV